VEPNWGIATYLKVRYVTDKTIGAFSYVYRSEKEPIDPRSQG